MWYVYLRQAEIYIYIYKRWDEMSWVINKHTKLNRLSAFKLVPIIVHRHIRRGCRSGGKAAGDPIYKPLQLSLVCCRMIIRMNVKDYRLLNFVFYVWGYVYACVRCDYNLGWREFPRISNVMEKMPHYHYTWDENDSSRVRRERVP